MSLDTLLINVFSLKGLEISFCHATQTKRWIKLRMSQNHCVPLLQMVIGNHTAMNSPIFMELKERPWRLWENTSERSINSTQGKSRREQTVWVVWLEKLSCFKSNMNRSQVVQRFLWNERTLTYHCCLCLVRQEIDLVRWLASLFCREGSNVLSKFSLSEEHSQWLKVSFHGPLGFHDSAILYCRRKLVWIVKLMFTVRSNGRIVSRSGTWASTTRMMKLSELLLVIRHHPGFDSPTKILPKRVSVLRSRWNEKELVVSKKKSLRKGFNVAQTMCRAFQQIPKYQTLMS